MRGILYDIFHNSTWGTISRYTGGFAVLYCALYVGLSVFYFWNRCYRQRDLRKLRKFLVKKGHVRKIHLAFFTILLVICILSFLIFLFKDWGVEHQDYKYLHTTMAEQQDLKLLFSNEVQVKLNKNEDENEDIRKLHIVIEFPIKEITEGEINKRTAIFKDIYQVGTKTPDTNIELDAETENNMKIIRDEVDKMESETFAEYHKEYEDWSILFEKQKLPADLYQSSRAARDMIEVGRSECSDEELLKIAAEAVYRSESFLEYDNRNINTVDEPIIMTAKDILFDNGKLFYQLYLETEKREALKVYRNDFIVNAYVCMFLAGEAFTENDTEYAKVNYYIGNIREKMLNEIPIKESFYETIKKDALKHYKIALNSLRNRQDYYNKESNMEENCKKGIKTLKGKVDL